MQGILSLQLCLEDVFYIQIVYNHTIAIGKVKGFHPWYSELKCNSSDIKWLWQSQTLCPKSPVPGPLKEYK